jgi:hypothetical protein
MFASLLTLNLVPQRTCGCLWKYIPNYNTYFFNWKTTKNTKSALFSMLEYRFVFWVDKIERCGKILRSKETQQKPSSNSEQSCAPIRCEADTGTDNALATSHGRKAAPGLGPPERGWGCGSEVLAGSSRTVGPQSGWSLGRCVTFYRRDHATADWVFMTYEDCVAQVQTLCQVSHVPLGPCGEHEVCHPLSPRFSGTAHSQLLHSGRWTVGTMCLWAGSGQGSEPGLPIHWPPLRPASLRPPEGPIHPTPELRGFSVHRERKTKESKGHRTWPVAPNWMWHSKEQENMRQN